MEKSSIRKVLNIFGTPLHSGKFLPPVANLPPVSLIPMTNLPLVSLIPVVHLDLRISPRFLKKFKMTLMLFSGACVKMMHEKS